MSESPRSDPSGPEPSDPGPADRRAFGPQLPDAESQRIRHDIASELLRVHHESYGTGASDVQVHLAEDLVVIVLDIELNPAERTLMTAGRGEAVKMMRETCQLAIGPTFTAIVERATGRRVGSFVSSIRLAVIYSGDVFRLRPETSEPCEG